MSEPARHLDYEVQGTAEPILYPHRAGRNCKIITRRQGCLLLTLSLVSPFVLGGLSGSGWGLC